MILTAVRVVADWLADATNGVNAQIDTITLDGSDSVPDDVAAIKNETEDTAAALMTVLEGETTPVIYVVHADSAIAPIMVAQSTQDATVTLAIHYFHKNTDAAAGIRDGHYVLRAVRKSLNILFNGVNHSQLTRNDMQVTLVSNIRYDPRFTVIEDKLFGQALLVDLVIRDRNP